MEQAPQCNIISTFKMVIRSSSYNTGTDTTAVYCGGRQLAKEKPLVASHGWTAMKMDRRVTKTVITSCVGLLN